MWSSYSKENPKHIENTHLLLIHFMGAASCRMEMELIALLSLKCQNTIKLHCIFIFITIIIVFMIKEKDVRIKY